MLELYVELKPFDDVIESKLFDPKMSEIVVLVCSRALCVAEAVFIPQSFPANPTIVPTVKLLPAPTAAFTSAV